MHTQAARIAELNDAFRRTLSGGRVLITQGVQALGPEAAARALQAVQSFSTFTPDNDPYGEHDFGSFEIAGKRLFWKLDYHDANMEYGSPNPTDPAVTTRVLTIMLVEEY